MSVVGTNLTLCSVVFSRSAAKAVWDISDPKWPFRRTVEARGRYRPCDRIDSVRVRRTNRARRSFMQIKTPGKVMKLKWRREGGNEVKPG
jgi:hypothetical protein